MDHEQVAMRSTDDELFDELRSAVRPDDGAPAVQPLEDALRGRFELLGEDAVGGQGTVRRARDLASGQVVALKILRPRRRSSLRDRFRFEREVDLAAGLQHPNIVRVHRSYSIGGHNFYSMDWIDGEPLDRAVDATSSMRERIELLLGVCSGVAHAHRHGVIHRDLKPSNILVDRNRVPRVLDFGLAKGLGEQIPRVTRSGEFLGTLGFAAPEQLAGGVADTRSDVYALGVISYELLTGHSPYDVGGGIATYLERVRNEAPREPALDADLRTILATALRREPSRRYPSVHELAEDFRRYLEDRPILARGESVGYRLGKWFRRHRRPVVVGACILVVAASVASTLASGLAERRQRRASSQVRELLSRTLAATRIPDVLEETAARLQHTLEDSPGVRAALRFTIGDTYRRRWMDDAAVPHLRKALDLYTEVHGRDHLEVARSLDALGRVLGPRQDRQATVLLERAVAIRSRELGSDHELTALSKRHLGDAIAAQYIGEDRARAHELFAEALAILESRFGHDHLEVAATRQRIDRMSVGELSTNEVERRFCRNLAVFRRDAHEDPRVLIEALNSYAWLLIESGRFGDAENVLQESMKVVRDAFGEDQVADFTWRMACFEVARGEHRAAEHLFRRSLASQLESWAARRPERTELRELAATLAATSDAQPAYRRTFAALIELEGRGRYELAADIHQLAELFEKQGRMHLAMRLLEDSLVIRCRRFGNDCPHRLMNLFYLGQLHLRARELDTALARLTEAHAIVRRVGHAQSVRGAIVTSALATAHIEVGALDKAGPLLLEAHAVFAKHEGKADLEMLANLRAMTTWLTQRGELDRAEAVRKQAEALARTLGSEDR